MTLGRTLSDLITEYLGPKFPKPGSQGTNAPAAGSNAAKVGATLLTLRNKIDSDPNAVHERDVLIWQLREAIRTEFFQIFQKKYPTTPPDKLLRLVTASEVILTQFGTSARPLYFPGARVAVPTTEANKHRPATTLQLRFKPVNGTTVTEVLLHLDGPQGGSFQWVPSQILMLLSTCVPVPQQSTDAKNVAPRTNATFPRASGTRGRRALSAAAAATSNYGSRQPKNARSRRNDTRQNGVRNQTTTLPSTFLPYALRSTSPPPQKRIRTNEAQYPLSLTSGSIRRTLDTWNHCDELSLPRELQNKVLERTLGIEHILGRRKNLSLGGIVQYYVKWSGAPLAAASWESRAALMQDVPGLVLAFDASHPGPPTMCRVEIDNERAQGASSPFDEVDCGSSEPSDEPVIHSSTGVAIPAYVDTPILELSFCGMEVHIRRDRKYSFFTDMAASKLDKKKRLVRFKKENPDAFARVFLNDSEYHADSKMTKHTEISALTLPKLATDLLPVLQKSLESHIATGQRPILFPRGLGTVLPREISRPVPLGDIIEAPASWESYLIECGMRCSDWSRELLPDIPTSSEVTEGEMERAAVAMHDKQAALLESRNKIARLRTRRYIGKPRIPRNSEAVDAAKPEEGENNESDSASGSTDIVKAAIEAARAAQNTNRPVKSLLLYH